MRLGGAARATSQALLGHTPTVEWLKKAVESKSPTEPEQADKAADANKPVDVGVALGIFVTGNWLGVFEQIHAVADGDVRVLMDI